MSFNRPKLVAVASNFHPWHTLNLFWLYLIYSWYSSAGGLNVAENTCPKTERGKVTVGLGSCLEGVAHKNFFSISTSSSLCTHRKQISSWNKHWLTTESNASLSVYVIFPTNFSDFFCTVVNSVPNLIFLIKHNAMPSAWRQKIISFTLKMCFNKRTQL